MAKLPLGGVNQAGLGELWGRIRFLFLGLIVYRIGTFIPVPGIDPARVAAFFNAWASSSTSVAHSRAANASASRNSRA